MDELKNISKKNKIILGLLIILVLIGSIFSYLYITDETRISKKEKDKIIEGLENIDMDILSEYTDTEIRIDSPVGKSSQLETEFSEDEEVKEYKELYIKEREEYYDFQKKNMKIEYGDLVYDEIGKRYIQKANIESYSLIGYSIVYNDLLLFFLEMASEAYPENITAIEDSKKYFSQNGYDMIRTLAMKYTNDYISKFNETYKTEVEFIWVKDKDGNLKCENMDNALGILLDPEGVKKTTEGFSKWHLIAYDIMDEIYESESFDKTDPLSIQNLK